MQQPRKTSKDTSCDLAELHQQPEMPGMLQVFQSHTSGVSKDLSGLGQVHFGM